MFRYAFARALQEKCSESMTLSFQQVDALKGNAPGWENSLRYFQVKPFKIYEGQQKLMFSMTNPIQKLACVVHYLGLRKFSTDKMQEQYNYQCKFQPLLNRLGIYWMRQGYYDFKIGHTKNKLVSGSFESPRYFDAIRNKLLDEFTPIYSPLNKNREIYGIIEKLNSVCVTVRRGDFVDNPVNKRIHDLCTKEYFYKAMDIISSKINEPVFIVFSDDIDWVKNNMQFKYKVFFESGSDPIWEKLRMMYSCKHFILSNSTFSWWAQYLSRNPNKTVISPSRWFNNNFKSFLISDDWIKILV